MKQVIGLRVSDHAHIIDANPEGFVTRKRTPIQKTSLFFVAMAMVVLGVSVIVYNDSMVGVYLCCGLGIILLFIGTQIEKIKKNFFVSEFMNALFSSVLSKKHQFVLIADLGGRVLYFNRSFQEFFKGYDASERTLASLMSFCNVSEEYSNKLMNAIKASEEQRVGLIMQLPNEAAKPVSWLVEPIDRPTGFVLLRGE